jgi:hypothetical protein
VTAGLPQLDSPELGIKKSFDRGHLPVVIRKAGLNGPPGLREVRARSIPTLEHQPAPAATRPASPFLVRARSAYLDRVRQTSPASPNAVAPLAILHRVASPVPAVETCPAQLILISVAAGHSVPAAHDAQSPRPTYCPRCP